MTINKLLIAFIIIGICLVFFFVYKKQRTSSATDLQENLNGSTVKPYTFNNYEKTLPEKPKGYYKSYPTKDLQEAKNVKTVDGIQLTIVLTGVKSKEEVFKRFYTKFGFNLDEIQKPSWDAFGDNLWFIKTTSGIFQEINPQVIHVTVVNLNDVRKYNERDYNILSEILKTSEDNSRFSDGFQLIFEIKN